MKSDAYSSRFQRTQCGSVLVEYVLVVLVTVVALTGISGFLFEPTGRAFDLPGAVEGESFGILGDAFVQLIRQILYGALGHPNP